METTPQGMKTGVLIGRFQTPYLHEGHKRLIDIALAENDIVFILFGCTKNFEKNEKNPYTVKERWEMVQKTYPDKMIIMGMVVDMPGEDHLWSHQVDEILDQCSNPTLYGGRDSFHSHYKGKYPFIEIESVPNISATAIREQLKNQQDGITNITEVSESQ